MGAAQRRGRCIETITKSETYKFSGAVERRKFLYANLLKTVAVGWSRGYVYLHGGMIAQYDNSTTHFIHSDQLGSTRVITQMNSTTPYDSLDYMPFGEQISGDTGTSHKFEGKERDPETNNDDFGARYYSSQQGRWLTPDWSAREEAVPYATLANPQTLNLYAMVADNPESFADLDGHDPQVEGLPDWASGGAEQPSSRTTCFGIEGATRGSGSTMCVSTSASTQTSTDQEKLQNQATAAQQRKEVGAEVYAEKTNGRADEYKAMASVIVNRANSGEKQYVQKGEDVNIHNVVSDKQQLQAYGSTNYNNFYNGSPKVSTTARATVEGAVGDVFKNGATTKATFFIANQGGAAPTRAQIHALGSVVPASTATVGGVYLYVVRPSGPGP